MNGGIDLKKRFESFILFRRPFVSLVRRHKVTSPSPSALISISLVTCTSYSPQRRLVLSAQHVAPSVENVAAPFNGAIRAGDSLFAISRHAFARPRHYTVGPAIMENSGLRWVKVGHWPQGWWRIWHY